MSLGCPKNLVDSEVMMGLLDRAGARLTARPEDAEILVVNTCSFIDTAKQESVSTILEMARHKTRAAQKNSSSPAASSNAIATKSRRTFLKSTPSSAPASSNRSSKLPALNSSPAPIASSPFTILTTVHAETRPGKESQSGTHKARPEGDARERSGRFLRDAWAGASSTLPTYLYDETTPRLLSTPRASAYIKIAEGCDHPCTFCVIPNLRGKFRSRRFESVVAEAEQLVARGVREITLIGQDTTCYGEDLGLRDGLATLLDRLARIPNLNWLRFLYAYPNRITGKLLETIAQHDNICKYLDLPLQHASSDVLKRMNRWRFVGGMGPRSAARCAEDLH